MERVETDECARERLMRCERLSVIETLRLLALAEAGRQQWVPVSTRLPESGQDCLIWREGFGACVARFWNISGPEWAHDFLQPELHPVTHWRLLAPPSAPVLPEPIQEHRSTSPSDHLPENAFPRPARRVSVFYGKFREQRGIHSGIALTFNEWMDFAEEWGRSLALYEHQMENKNGL